MRWEFGFFVGTMLLLTLWLFGAGGWEMTILEAPSATSLWGLGLVGAITIARLDHIVTVKPHHVLNASGAMETVWSSPSDKQKQAFIKYPCTAFFVAFALSGFMWALSVILSQAVRSQIPSDPSVGEIFSVYKTAPGVLMCASSAVPVVTAVLLRQIAYKH